VEETTGIFINPHHHENEGKEGGSTPKSDTPKAAPVGAKANAAK
jgi:hypothetical protein